MFGSERSAALLKKWFKLKPKEIQPVFCAVNHGRCLERAICDRQVNEIIKQALVRVKRYPRPSDFEISGHSLRVGAAQDLLIQGHDMAAIMRAGGWSEQRCRRWSSGPAAAAYLRQFVLLQRRNECQR